MSWVDCWADLAAVWFPHDAWPDCGNAHGRAVTLDG